MRRVVVTGLGIISCIGNDANEVADSLKAGRSGITFDEKQAELGFRSQVSGRPTLNPKDHVHKRSFRFMGEAAGWSAVAMQQALEDAGLTDEDISDPRIGIIAGSGGPSSSEIVRAADITRKNTSPKRIGPFAVPKAMSSTISATLATHFKIKGVNYSITSACTTSLHCIGAAVEQIQWGKQDMVFAGGGEELEWPMTSLFDAMGAMSSKYNDAPATASRAFDVSRDGFVIAGGAGMLVLEEYEHAKARGAKIYAEVIGYGLSGDAYHITAPSESGEGGERSMRAALGKAGLEPKDIDYINAHGTSTMADVIELGAVERMLGDAVETVTMSSTKSATGHLLGAAGAIEAIFSILAIRDQVAPPTINLDNPAVETKIDLAPNKKVERKIDVALSNSFGFGGTNASVIFGKAS